MPNIFCNQQVQMNCGNGCSQGYQVTQTYYNRNNYHNGYQNQNNYQNNYQSSYNPSSQVNTQPYTSYGTTSYPYSNFQINNEVIEDISKYNMASKPVNGDLPIMKPIVYPTSPPVYNNNGITKKVIPQETPNFTLKSENIVASSLIQTSTTTPYYIRSTKPIYNPDYNFPLYFATPSTTTAPPILKINLKKQITDKVDKIDTYVKKDNVLTNDVFDNNSSMNLSPKKSQTYRPIENQKENYKKTIKKKEKHDGEKKEDDDSIKIAGLNYFMDPSNNSLTNSIYDEVIPLDDNIDQVEVVPSSITTPDSHFKSFDVQNTLDYEDENSIDRRYKAKASKQYKKDDPITTNIINDDLIKIPLESTYERCNDRNLLKIMKRSMLASPVISKQLIFSSWKKEFNENLDVICSKIPFSYTVVSSSIYCEIQTVSISCFAYIQPTAKKI
uniref:Ground-like domain-containing protein n=1 Tax=Strongyloides venezuelensis TaxID=75913 RepID=A0A0K0F1E1_STRVS